MLDKSRQKVNTASDRVRLISLILFFAILGTGFVVGFIIPLRPRTSDIEQRQLASFPNASAEDILNGTYFDDISTWYSDSYPGRETLITINDRLKSFYGIQEKVQVIGTSLAKDDIPDIPARPVNNNSNATTPDAPKASRPISESKPSKPVTPDYSNAEPPSSKAMEKEIKQHIQQNLYVKDGAAHSLYYYSQKVAESYTGVIENAAIELDGICNVYNILVPNSSGVMLSEKELEKLGGSNQADAVHYYYSRYDKATGIESVDVLREHNDEYLFFRTDHHWTALGAYYVYRNYCDIKGWTPNELDDYEQVTFSPFLGSYYTSLKRSDMASNPDYITAYIPIGTNSLTYYDKKGKPTDYEIIHDVSKWSAYTKYNTFIGGDQPMQKIVNGRVRNLSSCLVIKESYGNCFVPFLVDHYNTVYVIDYRYNNTNLIRFIKEHGIDDLIVINNISIIGAKGVRSKLGKMLSE